jgi:hypothetical protein
LIRINSQNIRVMRSARPLMIAMMETAFGLDGEGLSEKLVILFSLVS